MTGKLILRNIRKNIKDYAIYFFTLVFAVCIFYMFNSIDAQKEIMRITSSTNQSMELLTKILWYISIFISIILGFLIIYANMYFIKRRKKEIGIYQILGMEKKEVSFILVLETMIIGVIALIVGSALGIFLSQFMSIFTAKIFETDMSSYKFVFSISALMKSILYFGITFIVVAIFNLVSISRSKLIHYIYGSVKNENLKLNNTILSVIIFSISLGCLGIAYYIFATSDLLSPNPSLVISVILGFVGTLMFFYSLAAIITRILQKNKNIYYKDLNIFVSRQINSKINTNFFSISMVAILLFFTITILSSGLSVEKVMSDDLRRKIVFDVSYFNFHPNDAQLSVKDNLPKELKDKKYVSNLLEYKLYYKKHLTNGQVFGESDSIGFNKSTISFMKLSDYNRLAKYKGKEQVALSDKQYLIANVTTEDEDYVDKILNKNISVNLNENKLYPKGQTPTVIYNERRHIVLVVNDKYTKYLIGTGSAVNIDLVDYDKYGKEYQELIDDKLNSEYYPGSNKLYIAKQTKYKIYTGAIGVKAVVSFLSIYLGLVFLMTSSVLLAIQQLSEAQDNKKRYDLLNKFGVERKMINKALFVQIAVYFIVPLLLGMLHSIFAMIAINNVIVQLGEINIFSNLLVTSGYIISVYGLYFIITYFQSKNVITKRK